VSSHAGGVEGVIGLKRQAAAHLRRQFYVDAEMFQDPDGRLAKPGFVVLAAAPVEEGDAWTRLRL
jgi:hypothetical protein